MALVAHSIRPSDSDQPGTDHLLEQQIPLPKFMQLGGFVQPLPYRTGTRGQRQEQEQRGFLSPQRAARSLARPGYLTGMLKRAEDHITGLMAK